MIFVGDIAIPKGACGKPPLTKGYFGTSTVVANLEGAILHEGAGVRGTRLYNDQTVLAYLQRNNVRVVSLANNHIVDIDRSPHFTIRMLREHGILSCGAGDSLEEASRPVLLEDAEGDIVFLSFGWDIIGCRIASADKAGVNPLCLDAVLVGIEKAQKAFREKPIVLLMHWDYELELYPQPMHRQIAYLAIDHGASAVVGCHSHCVQGIELYKDSPIVYGLGNWFFPEGQVFGRNVRFPDFALRQLAFEWILSSGEMKCHWFSYNRRTGSVDYELSEALPESQNIAKLTPFAGMEHHEYVKWFKHHRRKKIFLPVYQDSHAYLGNNLRDVWVKARHLLVCLASATQLKGGLR
jgi:hypothetical protein